MKTAWISGGMAALCLAGCNMQQATAARANETPGTRWVRFVDRREQGFAAEVPGGWLVTGGVYRYGQIDPRFMIDAISPDRTTDLRVGDANVPRFTTLSRMMIATGFREGSPYNPGGRVQGVIANYRPGHVFADLYAQARFSGHGRRLERKRVQITKPINPMPGAKTTAGWVLYTWDSGRGPMAGYVYAETTLAVYQDTGTWNVQNLFSFEAPRERAAEAMKMLYHIAASVEMNPRWVAQQIRMAGDATARINEEGLRAARQRAQARAAEVETHEAQQEQIDNIIKGVTVTDDPATGQRLEVWSGANSHHWINPQGSVVDTPSDMAPGQAFRQLKNRPR